MSVSRLLYRSRQLWQAMFSAPTEIEMESVRTILNPAQMELFHKLHPSEQAHSIRTMQALVGRSQELNQDHRQDLLVAALLHDAGKSLHPLKVWERAWIVVARKLLPRADEQTHPEHSPRWKRALVVSARHPEWGAQLAEQVGASPRTVELIRRHQENNRGENMGSNDPLLQLLQSVDHEM